LTGLSPDTHYFYSIGTEDVTIATGDDFAFFTTPAIGTSHPTRIWVLGDSGTADGVAKAVREGYRNFAGDRKTDVWLMLGDNAYNSGTDPEYQAAVFDLYPDYLRQTVLWSALGNHETAQALNPDIATTPYFNIFSLPAQGEAGGVASGTEKYYSFDYGRIHFIALDSMTSDRSPGSPMLTWLQTDLEATSQDWIIAFWHHPPYTKGSHDSDREYQLVEMRENVLPILEAGGVDLVLTGHSHCYERSFLINGHYGLSSTFDESMKLDGGSGREDETGAYSKPGALAANQGTVYAVAGNGGHVTFWASASIAEFNPKPHPVMFYSALHPGSMAIDIEGNRLEARMIRETGAIDDSFTIVKNVPNQPPVVRLATPVESASFSPSAEIKITASAHDRDGKVAQVDFYANDSLIGVATAAPYSITWSDMPAGRYTLTAAATDNLGATVTSAPATVHIDNLVPVPAAPSNLSANAVSSFAIDLAWTDNADNETGFMIECSKNGKPFRSITRVDADVTSYQHSGRKSEKTFRYRVRAVNASGTSLPSNLASAKMRRK
ncbi:MAG: metallophosphoesterase, partial [Chthoniobacteraceae bacterium]